MDEQKQQAAPAANDDVEKNKTMAIVGYLLPILFFVPLLSEAKNSPFAKFHANQQLVLLIAWVAISFAMGFVYQIVPRLGWPVQSLCSLALFVLAIIGLLGAAKGEMKPLPLLGQISILK